MIRLALSISLTAAFAASQGVSFYVPDNMPGSGTNNVIPFGNSKTSTTWANQKYQMLIPASTVNNQPTQIRDFGFAPSSSNVHNFDRIIVRVGLTTSATLSATFADNIKIRPMTLLDAKNYTWTLKANQWTRIGIQTPYLWVPTLGNLVVDIECYGTGGATSSTGGFHRSTTIERKYAFGWTGTPPTMGNSGTSLAATKIELVVSNADASAFGEGCKGSNGTPTLSYVGLPQVSKTLTQNLSNAKTNSVAVTVLGFKATSPLPVDLTAAGAPGCFLFQSLDVLGGTPTNASGSASLSLPIPNDKTLAGVVFYNQFFVLDPTINSLKLVGSNFGRVLIGL